MLRLGPWTPVYVLVGVIVGSVLRVAQSPTVEAAAVGVGALLVAVVMAEPIQ